MRRTFKRELSMQDMALKKLIRPKPRWIPQFAWTWFAKIIIKDLNI